MIHIDFKDGSSKWFTDEQLKKEEPELYAIFRVPRPFNEGGEIIKKARQKADITTRELAKACGFPLGLMSDIETGKTEATQEQIDVITYAIQNHKEREIAVRKHKEAAP